MTAGEDKQGCINQAHSLIEEALFPGKSSGFKEKTGFPGVRHGVPVAQQHLPFTVVPGALQEFAEHEAARQDDARFQQFPQLRSQWVCLAEELYPDGSVNDDHVRRVNSRACSALKPSVNCSGAAASSRLSRRTFLSATQSRRAVMSDSVRVLP